MMTDNGFIGGGERLETGGSVHGTATGAIGAALAWQRYEIAIVLSAMTWATLRAFAPGGRFARTKNNDG